MIVTSDPTDPDRPDCTNVPCVDCGRPIGIYPPEDGLWLRRCGRCGHTPMAMHVRPLFPVGETR